MAAIDQIIRRDRTPAYALIVAGVPVIYTSTGSVDRSYTVNGDPFNYQVKRAIVPNRGFTFSRELNDDDHLVESRPITVELVYDPASADPLEPDRVFGRLGLTSADSVATLAEGQSILQTDGPDVTLTMEDSGAGFSVGDVVHVGREAFSVSAITPEVNQITLSDRGLLGTQRADHCYDPDTRVQPFIVKPAVFFTSRRALILESAVLEDGTTTGWVERWRGFVSKEPEFGRAGAHTISISIAPLTALLDQPLGPVNLAENRFHPSAHAFGGFGGAPGEHPSALHSTSFDICEETRQGFIRLKTPEFTRDPVTGLPDASGISGLPVLSHDPHSTVAGVANLPDGHPRTFPVFSSDRNRDDTVFLVNGYSGPLQAHPDFDAFLDIGLAGVGLGVGDAVPTQSQALGPFGHNSPVSVKNRPDNVHTVRTVEWRNRSLIDLEQFELDGVWPQVHAWPGRLIETFNDPISGLNVPSTQTLSGGLTTSTLNVEAGEITAGLNRGVRGSVRYHVTNDADGERTADNGDEAFKGWSWRGAEKRRRDTAELLPVEVFALTGDDGTRTLELSPGGNGRAAGRISTRVATRYFGRGEGFLTLERPVTVPAAGLFLEASREGEDEPIGIFRIVSVETRALNGSPVYVARLANPLNNTPGGGRRNQGMMPTIAEYDPNGSDRVIFKPVAVFSDQPVGELLLKILVSSGGAGVNHPAFDVLSYGAELNAVDGQGLGLDIDVASFLRIESTLSDAEFFARWREGESVLDVVGGILKTCGFVLDMQTNQAGLCRLSAVPLGTPNQVDVVANIGTNDIAQSPTPTTKTQTRIRNAFEIKANYNAAGEAQFERTIKDAVSIDLFQKEERMTIDLTGVQLSDGPEAIEDLMPLFSRLRALNSFPGRQYEFSIRAGLSALCKVGGTYSISHPLLRSGPNLGAVSVLCRLRSVSGGGWDPVARVVFDVFSSSGTGWAPSLEVVAVVDAVTVQVNPLRYAPEEHPATGEALNDIDGFSALQTNEFVMTWNRGEISSVQKVAAVSADLNQVQFSAAHNLSVGARITPAPQSVAANQHQSFAFIGSTVVS